MKIPSIQPLFAAAVLFTGSLGALAPPALGEAPAPLVQRQEKVIKVAQGVMPAVVAIVPGISGPDEKPKGMGSGSGVIVSNDGLILTAGHVLKAVGEEFEVILANGARHKAKSLGKAYGRDAAVAQITDKGSYPHVERAEPDQVNVGDWCLALGHPGGYEVDRNPPVRLGRVLEADVDSFLVTDCTLSGGDSGGPLFNLDGKLIGIHSSIGWQVAENRHVPMQAFKENWDRLMKGDSWGKLSLNERRNPFRRSQPDADEEENDSPAAVDEPKGDQPVLGVLTGPSEDEGALVGQVTPGSPAAKAGLEAGDLIEKVDGKAVSNSEQLVASIRNHKPGDTVKLTVDRDGKPLELEARLVAAKDLK